MFPDFDSEKLEEIENKKYEKLEKEYSERRQPLEMWQGDAMYIKDRMYEYINYVRQPDHYAIKEAVARSKLLRDTDIDNDSIIIDYKSSQSFVDTHCKKSTSSFKDENFSYPSSYLARYIIQPDEKLHGIISREKMLNRGRAYEEREEVTYDERGNEIRTTYTVKGSFKREISVDEVYEPQTSNNFIGTGDNKKQLHNDVTRYTDLSSVKLSDAKHVRVLLERYSEWRHDIKEQGNTSEEFSELLDRLDLIIETASFDHEEMCIIGLVKQSEYSHKQILELVNKKFGNTYSYRQINYAITENIPLKIAKVAAKVERAMSNIHR